MVFSLRITEEANDSHMLEQGEHNGRLSCKDLNNYTICNGTNARELLVEELFCRLEGCGFNSR
jgi:hypothetical protein